MSAARQDFTPEQREAIYGKQPSKAAILEERVRVVDQDGVIEQEQDRTVMRTDPEPDFIKVYYKTMLTFKGIDDIPVSFILALSSFISWSNDDSESMLFYNVKRNRESICSQCGIKDSMYAKYLKRCVSAGLLILDKQYRGTYYVNPFFIAKGKWANIKKLRATFDYIDNTWSKTMEEESNDA